MAQVSGRRLPALLKAALRQREKECGGTGLHACLAGHCQQRL